MKLHGDKNNEEEESALECLSKMVSIFIQNNTMSTTQKFPKWCSIFKICVNVENTLYVLAPFTECFPMVVIYEGFHITKNN